MRVISGRITLPILLILLYLSTSTIAFSQGRNEHGAKRSVNLVPISVSGKVIVDSTATSGKKYYLDTNNAGSKDYRLSFGPIWYIPASGAIRPLAGETVSIKGDMFLGITPPVISVNEINGLIWRDSTGIKFVHNPVDRDSLKNRHNPWGNKFGWCVKDSLIDISLNGTAIVDSVGTKHKVYYLDLQGNGGKDYILMFGPSSYTPKSGAIRPLTGDKISIEGGLIQKTDTLNNILNFVIVYKINGLAWIDSVGKFPWPGRGIGRNHNSGTSLSSIYNSKTNIEYDSRSFGMGMDWKSVPDNLYTSIMEIDPVYLPVEYSGNVVAAYSINVMDNDMNGILKSFSKKIRINLSYSDKELAIAGVKNQQLKLKYIGEDNTLKEVSSANINYLTKIISFSEFEPSGVYIIETPQNSSLSVKVNSVIPEKISLDQNYPNPFNPETKISFAIPQSGNVKLTIYSIIGSEVKTLVNNYFEAGSYNFNWDGTNNAGMKVSSGIYLYKLESGNSTITKRMNLLK